VAIWSSLRRRWILACFLLALTFAGTAFALVKLPWTYQARSSVVLLIPTQEAKTVYGNPYLGFSPTLNETADVVRYEVMDIRIVNLLAARGYTGTYLVVDAIDTSGPVLTVTVTSKDKAVAEHTLYGVTSEISTKLNELQVGLTSARKIRVLVITFTPQATRLSSKKARPLIVVAAVGLILTAGISVTVDVVLLRRRDRRGARQRGSNDERHYRLGAAGGGADDDHARTPNVGELSEGAAHRGEDGAHHRSGRKQGRTVRRP
jgi:hypothetical protein